MRRGGVGGGGKGFNDGRDDGGKGSGGYNLGMVDADMWVCRQCSTHSFLSRRQCFGCGALRPTRPTIATERWPGRLVMGKGAGVGAEPGVRGAREMERRNPRVPLLQWSNGTGGARLQGKGEGKGRGGAEANEARKETEGNGKGNNGENGKPKKGIATRAKAIAKPSQGASTQEATKQEGGGERHNDEEEESIPPPFMPPLPRFILESRAKVLGSKVVELERDDQEGKKQRRTKRLLEQTMADLREAGD